MRDTVLWRVRRGISRSRWPSTRVMIVVHCNVNRSALRVPLPATNARCRAVTPAAVTLSVRRSRHAGVRYTVATRPKARSHHLRAGVRLERVRGRKRTVPTKCNRYVASVPVRAVDYCAAAAPPTSLLMMWTFPFEIETARLVLRQWRRADAPMMWALLKEHWQDLGDPSWELGIADTDPEEHQVSPSGVRDEPETDWVYAIRPRSTGLTIGSIGLHRRRHGSGLELGYWLIASSRGYGFASEAVDAVLTLAFEQPALDDVQICCDRRNLASAAVARRLGFSQIAEHEPETAPSAASPDTMLWQITRETRARREPGTR